MSRVQASLGAALKWGLFLGLLVGHLDLFNRILALNLEWFEVYQALLLPALLFSGVFVAIALLSNLIQAIFRKPLHPEREKQAYQFIFFSSSTLILFTLALHLGIYGDIVVWDERRFVLNTVALTLSCLAAIFFRVRADHLFLSIMNRAERSKLLEHYLFFICVLCISCLSWDLYQLRTFSESRHSPSARSQPNVILISLDTVRADHLGLYGYPKPTSPFLDAIAKDSAIFDFAISTSSWTLPSHASAFSGLYSFHHGAVETHQKLKQSFLTLAEVLQAQGYRTAGFVGGPYCKAKYGLGQGFDIYHDRLDFFEYRHTHDVLSAKNILDFFSPSFRKFLLRNDGERDASEINQDVIRWLERKDRNPFFLFINYFDAHDPYDKGARYRKLFSERSIDVDFLNQYVRTVYFDENRYEQEEPLSGSREDLVALYDAEIRYLDSKVEELFEALRKHKLLDNTLVVFFSDHGEEFFEHGGLLHKQTLYQEVIHVPLFFYFPQTLAANRSSTPVSLIDIMPSILGLLGIHLDSQMDGRNLFSSIPADKRFILSERYARPEHGESFIQSITDGTLKLILSEPQKPRIPSALYNLSKDPGERQSLLDTDKDEALGLREKLESMKTDTAEDKS